jgi:hypothetical protein
VAWEVEYATEFGSWWNSLTLEEQESIAIAVGLLQEFGPSLPFPKSSGIAHSKFPQMRELRIQHQGRPYRVLYCFDPRRTALLLIGGDKTGDDRWYETYVPLADKIYSRHLEELKHEKKKGG